MGMRSDCRHYDSRTYPSGDVVRKCRLDLAPEAPWKCPADCPKYERRRVDVAWQYGSLGESANRKPDPAPDMGDDVAKLLDEAEDIVNAAGLEMLAEQERARGPRKGLFRKQNKQKKRKR
jgi:hypothetical protein